MLLVLAPLPVPYPRNHLPDQDTLLLFLHSLPFQRSRQSRKTERENSSRMLRSSASAVTTSRHSALHGGEPWLVNN